MSQELTFQVQEFYSKVLWCAYRPGVPGGARGRWDGGFLPPSVCT